MTRNIIKIKHLRQDEEVHGMTFYIEGATFKMDVKPLTNGFLRVRQMHHRRIRSVSAGSEVEAIVRRFGFLSVKCAVRHGVQSIDASDSIEKALEYLKNTAHHSTGDVFPHIVLLLFNLFCKHRVYESDLSHQLYVTLMALFMKMYSHQHMRPCASPPSHSVALGFLMNQCADYLHEILQRVPNLDITKMFVEFSPKNQKGDQQRIRKMLRQWSADWSPDEIRHRGAGYARKVLDSLPMHSKLQPITIYMIGCVCIHLFMPDSLESFDTCLNDRRMLLTAAALTTDELYLRVHAIKMIANDAINADQLLFGLKLLRCVYRLCKGYMFPKFNDKRGLRKRRLEKKISDLSCVRCGDRTRKLSCCVGCFNTVYCSRKCQKKHWRSYHRRKCSMGIRSTQYDMLNTFIFKRL